jgi:hypothetical protein
MAMRVGHKLGRNGGARIAEILARKGNFALCVLENGKKRYGSKEKYFSICMRAGKRWYVLMSTTDWPYPILHDAMNDLPAEIRTAIALFELGDEVGLDELDKYRRGEFSDGR